MASGGLSCLAAPLLVMLGSLKHGGETQASLLQWPRPNGVHPVALGCSRSRGGTLMYEQVPIVQIDGMNLVETRAILRYPAAKYNLYGRNLQEQAWIDMYVEGLRDLSDMIMFFPLSLPGEKEMNLEYILEKATTRFFPVYEKALRDHGQDFLVGDWLSWADIQLLEVILMAEECKASVLAGFPLLQEFKARISYIPTIHKFLQPGSQRKPPLDEVSTETVKNIFKFERGMFLKNMGTIVAEY
ncbi:glutathione S-transferase-like isoform X3 [Lutra lutra]|uniref:glutathione S-transferase-like isoform X3 n=1 Tax=Lutra lutra TaxID=9657 RepID=UPI001FD5DF97|nr:glutathione S-transferase-like isoform X3 [Lutra lutra]